GSAPTTTSFLPFRMRAFEDRVESRPREFSAKRIEVDEFNPAGVPGGFRIVVTREDPFNLAIAARWPDRQAIPRFVQDTEPQLRPKRETLGPAIECSSPSSLPLRFTATI